MSRYPAVLLLSSLSIVTTALGVAIALWTSSRDRAVAAGIGFSVGIMVLVSAAELIPEAVREVGLGAASIAATLGVGLVWSAHLVIPHTHLVRESGLGRMVVVRSAYLVVLGLILHDVPEGFAMANAYVVTPELGVLTALAIALHNLPEEFVMAVPATIMRSKHFLFGAAVLSALAEPFGAVVGLVAVDLAPSLNGWFLAFAAGAMLFVSIHELIPMARRHGHPGLFAGGMMASLPTYLLLAFAASRIG